MAKYSKNILTSLLQHQGHKVSQKTQTPAMNYEDDIVKGLPHWNTSQMSMSILDLYSKES